MKALFGTFILLILFVAGCAGKSTGLLVQFDSTKPLDHNQLERHCDMEDSTACFLLGKPAERLARMPILQGMAPTGRAIFSALVKEGQKISWYVREVGAVKLSPLRIYQTHSRPHSPFRIEQILANELESGRSYELIAVNALGQLVDQRHFQTLPPLTSVRLALISSTDDHSNQADLWADLSAQNPQIIFSLGNNVYGTSRGPTTLASPLPADQLWDRYVETRVKLPIFTQEQLIPFMVTWNDRDFGMANGDKSYPDVEKSRLTLEAFFPQVIDTKFLVEGPGISRGLKIAGNTFLFLDNRSFRTPAKADEPAYFGRIQEDWAISQLQNLDKGPLWLMSGEKWFGKNLISFESTKPGPFVNFLAKLAQARKKKAPSPIVFASGAQSRTEIRKIPSFSTYEISSGFQSPAVALKEKDPRALAAVAGGYMILEIKGTEVKAQIRGSTGILAGKSLLLKAKR